MKLFTALAALTLIAAPVQAQAELHPDLAKGMIACRRPAFVDHDTDYGRGKSVAVMLNAREAENKINGTDFATWQKSLMRTRKGYAMTVVSILIEMEKHELAGCEMSLLAPLRKQPWSSIHSGLVDHLSPSLKTHFFSIPER